MTVPVSHQRASDHGRKFGKDLQSYRSDTPDSQLRVTSSRTRELFKSIQDQTHTQGLEELEEYRELGEIQDVEFFNYEMFYTIHHLVFWLLIRQAGPIRAASRSWFGTCGRQHRTERGVRAASSRPGRGRPGLHARGWSYRLIPIDGGRVDG